MGRDAPSTRDRILATTRRLVARRGLANVTLSEIGRALGVTRQAVLYWFPSKNDLLRELLYDRLVTEAEVVKAAVADAPDAAEAARRTIRAVACHHVEDLDGFRLLYMLGQLMPGMDRLMRPEDTATLVYPVTGAMYDAIEAALRADPELHPELHPRRLAVSLHLAGLGIALMYGLADASGDTLKHDVRDLADALADALARGVRAR